MEEDRLLRFHERLKDFLQKNLTKLLNLVLFFVIIIVLSGAWFFYQKNKEKRAFERFVEIIHRQDLKALEDFAKKYLGTQAGLQASLILWEALQKGGNPDQIRSGLENLKKVYPGRLEGFLLYAEAKVLEDSGKKKEALDIYQKILDKELSLRDQVLMDLARLTGPTKKDLAIKYYQEIEKNYPNFYGKGLAEYRLYELTRQ